MTRLGHVKTNLANTKLASAADDAALRELVKCGYVKSTFLADRFRSPSALNPDLDADIVGPAGIFTQAEYDADNEFRKTAAVMKMVINGYAGAGTVTMGGYDYHGQGRNTGINMHNRTAGRCIGAASNTPPHEQAADGLYLQRRLAVGERCRNNAGPGRGKLDWAATTSPPLRRWCWCIVRAAGWRSAMTRAGR
jgi:hypothetical protein